MRIALAALQRDAHGHLPERTSRQRVRTAERLRAKGKRPKVVITAVMRKLLLLAWTLLRTNQPFSPTHNLQLASA